MKKYDFKESGDRPPQGIPFWKLKRGKFSRRNWLIIIGYSSLVVYVAWAFVTFDWWLFNNMLADSGARFGTLGLLVLISGASAAIEACRGDL